MEDRATKMQIQYTDDRNNHMNVTRVWDNYLISINGQSVTVNRDYLEWIEKDIREIL